MDELAMSGLAESHGVSPRRCTHGFTDAWEVWSSKEHMLGTPCGRVHAHRKTCRMLLVV